MPNAIPAATLPISGVENRLRICWLVYSNSRYILATELWTPSPICRSQHCCNSVNFIECGWFLSPECQTSFRLCRRCVWGQSDTEPLSTKLTRSVCTGPKVRLLHQKMRWSSNSLFCPVNSQWGICNGCLCLLQCCDVTVFVSKLWCSSPCDNMGNSQQLSSLNCQYRHRLSDYAIKVTMWLKPTVWSGASFDAGNSCL